MGDPAIKMGPSIGAIPQSDSDSDWGQQEAKAGNSLSGQLTGVSSGESSNAGSARAPGMRPRSQSLSSLSSLSSASSSSSLDELSQADTERNLPGKLTRAYSLDSGLDANQEAETPSRSRAMSLPNLDLSRYASGSETIERPEMAAAELAGPGEPEAIDLSDLEEIASVLNMTASDGESDAIDDEIEAEPGIPSDSENDTDTGSDSDAVSLRHAPGPATDGSGAAAPSSAASVVAADPLETEPGFADRLNEEMVKNLFSGRPDSEKLLTSWKDSKSPVAQDKIVNFAYIHKLAKDSVNESNFTADQKAATLKNLDEVAKNFVGMVAADGLGGKTAFGAIYNGRHATGKKIKALEAKLETLSGGRTKEGNAALRKQMLSLHVYPFVLETLEKRFGGKLNLTESEIGGMIDFSAKVTLDSIVEAYLKGAEKNNRSIGESARALRMQALLPDLLRDLLEEQANAAAQPAASAATATPAPAPTPPVATPSSPMPAPASPPTPANGDGEGSVTSSLDNNLSYDEIDGYDGDTEEADDDDASVSDISENDGEMDLGEPYPTSPTVPAELGLPEGEPHDPRSPAMPTVALPRQLIEADDSDDALSVMPDTDAKVRFMDSLAFWKDLNKVEGERRNISLPLPLNRGMDQTVAYSRFKSDPVELTRNRNLEHRRTGEPQPRNFGFFDPVKYAKERADQLKRNAEMAE